MEERIMESIDDGKPMDYVDDSGTHWVMAACGHRVGGAPRPGDKIAMCPNCQFLIRFRAIDIKYPERLPPDYTLDYS